MTANLPSSLPSSPIPYRQEPLFGRLQRHERLDHRYDAGGYRIFEAARLSGADPGDAWRSVQRLPEIWDRLTTTSGGHRIVKHGVTSRTIDIGNVILADAVVLGVRFGMKNVVTTMVEPRLFRLSVRALGGRFESEVEACVEPLSAGTLMIWRQGYPDARLLSRLTSRVLASREAEEAKKILDLWVAAQEGVKFVRTPLPA